MINFFKNIFKQKEKSFDPVFDMNENFIDIYFYGLKQLRYICKNGESNISKASMFKIDFSEINNNYENYYFLISEFAKIGNKSIPTFLLIDNMDISIEEFRQKFSRLFVYSKYIIHSVNGERKILNVSDNISTLSIKYMSYKEFIKLKKELRSDNLCVK